MKIKDLPNWPPQPGGGFNASYKSPTSDQAILKELVRVQDNSVTFTATFEGKQFTYDYEVANSRVAKTLSDNDFNRIQGCRPQAKCDSTLGWSTPFGYS
jgi:hypothetical protein